MYHLSIQEKHTEKYWFDQFSGAGSHTLYFLKPMELAGSYNAEVYTKNTPVSLHALLEKVSGGTYASAYLLLLTAFGITYRRFSGVGDFIITVPDPENETQQMYFRCRIKDAHTGLEVLQQMKHQWMQYVAGGASPLHTAMEKVFSQEAADSKAFEQIGFSFRRQTVLSNDEEIPVHFQWAEADNILQLQVLMNAGIVEPRLVQSFTTAYLEVLQQLLQQVHLPVRSFQLLGAAALQDVISASAGAAHYPVEHTFMQMFDECVCAQPATIAIVAGGQSLTYEVLSRQVNQLSNYLREEFNIKPGDRVAVMLSRSEKNILCMLALWRCGAWYVPLDYHLPPARLSFLLGDIAPELLLTEYCTAYVPGTNEVPVVNMEDISLAKYSADAAQAVLSAEDISYIIYTSGSTGTPKGIMQTHGMLYNLTRWQATSTTIEHGMRYFQYTSFSFDVSIQDVCFVLHTGGTLYIASEAIRLDFTGMKDFVLEHKIEGLYFPYSVLSNFLQINTPESLRGHSLRHIISGSEQVVINAGVEDFFRVYPGVQLHDQYGPSETHVVTHFTFEYGITHLLRRMPIGKPVANTSVFLLDAEGRLVPEGVTGEIYISGANVAKGYWNLPDITESRFLQIEIAGQQQYVYRTGDLARRWPDGNLEYLGREDDQIKIKGYRVELGEIQKVLLQQELISDVAVILATDKAGDKHLAAYYCVQEPVSKTVIQSYLREKLPEYMIPAFLLEMGVLPLTANGKLDKKRLPDPFTVRTGYMPAQTPLQEKMTGIWETVLGVQQVGIDDDFFALGGYSLKAVKLLSALVNSCNVPLALPDIMRYTTIRSLSARIEKIPVGQGLAGIPLAPLQVYYPLSHGQRRMWILDKMNNNSAAYNIGVSYHITGSLQADLLATAVQYVVQQHESLRTVFREVNGEPFQFIQDMVAGNFAMELLDADLQENEVNDHISAASLTVFDLGTGPLFRCILAPRGYNKHILSFVIHHIVFDGWSMDNLLDELLEHYTALVRNRYYAPQAPVLQYKDYAAWQHQQLRSGAMAAAGIYWRNILSGELPVLDLPSKPRPVTRTHNGAFYHMQWQPHLLENFRQLAVENACSLFTVMTAFVKVMLWKYTGQQDLITGIPVSGRDHPDLLSQIGFYVNTLALRTRIDPEQSFHQYLSTVKDMMLSAMEHQQYPFDLLVSELHLQGDASRSPVFDVMISYQNMLEYTSRKIPGLEVQELPLENPSSKFDLNFHFTEYINLGLGITYNPDLFDATQVERMGAYFKALCAAILKTPDQPLLRLTVPLSEQETSFLFRVGGNTVHREYPAIQDLVQAYAKTAGQATAVVCEQRTLTYEALDQLAERVAAYLQTICQVQPGDFVGLMMDRTEKAIIGMLGILKTGAAYVPILPDYPPERIRFMLEDTGAKVALYEGGAVNDATFINIDLALVFNEAPALKIRCSGNDLACVLYTSGSTGQPKGVLITHKGIIRLVKDNNYVDITGEDRLLQVSNLAFDGSVFDIYGALLNGASVYLMNRNDLLSPPRFNAFVKQHAITIALITTALFNNLVDELPEIVQPFRRIYFGGEAGSLKHLRKAFPWLQQDSRLINLYGPTEGTTVTTWHAVTMADLENGIVPIGQPVTNTQVYIMDPLLRLQPVGVTGEICISGDGLAAGYLRREALTETMFVTHPLKTDEKLYRTGDLGYWREDGVIIFKGRKDNQVKVRGYRVECDEVAYVLQQAGAQQALVLPFDDKQDGSKYLAAYVSGIASADENNFKTKLSSLLPAYMIPAAIIFMNAIPVNANGKLDRTQLPAPVNYRPQHHYAAPENDLQAAMAGTWQNILGVDQIGIDDNFFEAGGNSLKAIKTITAMNEQGGNYKFTDLYKYATIRKLTTAALGLEMVDATGAIEEFDL